MKYINILETDLLCDSYSGYKLFSFLGNILNLLFIVVPIIIVIMGSIDLVKALIAQNDDEIKKSRNLFIKRLILGACIFFIFPIVSLVFGMVDGKTADESSNICLWSVLNPKAANLMAEGKKNNNIDLSNFKCQEYTSLKSVSDYMCENGYDCPNNSLCIKDGDEYKCCEADLE